MMLLKRLIGHVDQLSEEEAGALTETTPGQLDRALAFWRGLLNLKSAAERLQILPVQVKSLIHNGLLRSTRFGTALRYVHEEDIERLLAQVAALPEPPATEAVLPLRRHCRNHRIGLVRLITLWQKGEFEGLVRHGEGAGLQAIHVLQQADAGEGGAPAPGRDLTLPETASYLSIGIASVRALRDTGYLRHEKCLNADTNHHHTLITWRSICEFEERFLTLGQLAKASKVAPMHLARQLDRTGVPTVPCGSLHVRAYERVHVGRR